MKLTKRIVAPWLLAGALLAAGVWPAAWALPPAPPNDEVASAEVIPTTLPVRIYGTTVLANNSITALPELPAITAYVDGPDVFYSFTPAVSATYRFHLHPWQCAPLRSSDRRFVLYVLDAGLGIAGARAPGDARPVYLDVALNAGTTYILGVDHDDILHDNFEFTLVVDQRTLTNPDNCGSVETLPATLPALRVNNIDGALGDFTFVQGTGRCGVSGTTPTTAPGIDHVYKFTAPATGDYAIELVSELFDGVLYVNTACPPDYPAGCLGASNHSTTGTTGARHELVVVTLEAGQDYYVYVDNGSTTSNTGTYVLIIDDAFAYEISEVEPNDTPAQGSPLSTPLNGGQLVGPADVDWWAVPGLAGDRVYAWVNNGGSANSTLDTDLALYAADGTTLIEFDHEDGDGADAPIEDLRFIYSTTAPVIAGARLTSDATHYLAVTDTSATGTVHRYRFHVGVEPGDRSPLPECEPNDTLAAADLSGKHFYAGVIDTVTDRDVYAFEAVAGDRVFIALDGDPERDANGVDPANTDPNAFHAKLVIYDPAGDVLISDISDTNNVTSPPDYPAQAGFFVARTTGKHFVEVGPQGSSSQVGPTETYHLAIFLNEAAPALTEDDDPVLALTPDHANDRIDVTATDDGPTDTGICAVNLADATNVQLLNLSFTPGDPVVTFQIGLIDPNASGYAKLRVFDCAGNAACAIARIDVFAPDCTGFNFAKRTPFSLHGPIHVPDNNQDGINGEITIPDAGIITDVNVTITIETIAPPDMDVYLESPSGTRVELVTDRGSSLAFDITDATFDDSASEIMPILSSAAPYTGTWLPEDPAGLAKLNGENAQGTWKLNVIDDSSSSSTAGGGARLVRWSLDIQAGFPGPEAFAGTASDTQGFDAGIASIVLDSPVNTQLNLPPDFQPGDPVVEYTVTLIDPSQDGSGTVIVTDLAENTCQSVIALAGLPDVTAPANSGTVTTDLKIGAEVQASVPPATPTGVLSIVDVPDALVVGEVEVDLIIDTEDVGRLASILAHSGEFAALINRVGMTERGSVGLTKDNIEITLDDDAPVADDAHLEPALGTIEFLGLHQPDGRGEFIGDGISTDRRDNMLLRLGGLDSAGPWVLAVGDFRDQGTTTSTFRRWAATIKSPCGPERYVGKTMDLAPGSGIQSIALAGGASNLALSASFSPGDQVVSYVVDLVDPFQPGGGTVEITDGAGNVTAVPVSLAPAAADQNVPVVGGAVNLATFEYEGVATDNQPGDTGLVAVELAPFADNIQLVSVTPDPPAGAASVSFVVGLVNPAANGRGYVRVTDGCGWRAHALIEIDATPPVCSGTVGQTRRYFSTTPQQPIPDNDPGGVLASIVVTDTEPISDVDITFNIIHPFDDDIDLTLVSPTVIELFSDIGSTGNDFIDTTLDDEAAAPIPDLASAAPFTGSFQPEAGPALYALDGAPANAVYTLRAVDDAVYNVGRFLHWSVLIESGKFPQRYDGRAEDSETHATGLCAVELLPGAFNVSLAVDPNFVPGDAIMRYSVAPIYPWNDGTATVRVSDCVGNTCEVPVALTGFGPLPGDCNCDGVIDFLDIDYFVAALSGGEAGWSAFYASQHGGAAPLCLFANNDIDGNGQVDFFDIDPLVVLLSGGK